VLIIITVIKGKTETLCQLSSRVENLFRNDTSADYRNWTVNGTPARFAPWRWKFRSFSDRTGPQAARPRCRRFIRRGHTGRLLSAAT